MCSEIKNRIEVLLNELISIKGMQPGSISKQYNICGKPNCKCKDKENPQKHGPYFHLSYNVSGRDSGKFIKEDEFEIVSDFTVNYKRFREICREISGLYIDLFKTEGFNVELPDIKNILKSSKIEEQQGEIDKLEKELTESRKIIHSQQVTIRDTRKSRDDWKEKNMQSKTKAAELEKENISLKKKQEKLGNDIDLLKVKKKRHRRKPSSI